MGTNVRLIDPATGLPYRAGGTQNSAGQTVVTEAPSSDAVNAVSPVVAGAGGSALLVKASAGNLYGASITAGAVAGFFIAYNANSIPAGGASLTAGQIIYAVPVAANGYVSVGDAAMPDRFSSGIVLLFSTSTTTYTVPGTVALHIRGKAA